jgi:ADP-heptose:LPS heptosyltransferase
LGLGDELMLTGHARVMQQTDPRKVRVVYEKPNRWSEIFEHNPRLARATEPGDFQEYRARVDGLRPYCAAKSDTRWTWKTYGPPAGEVYLDRYEQAFANAHAGVVLIEPNIKRQASPNKDWGEERWHRLVWVMRSARIEPVQVGPRGTRRVNGALFIETENFRQACAVVSRARAVVTHEGGLHHAAAAFGIPAVVIYGGYISPAVTGYPYQVSLFKHTDEHPLGCGWRTPCAHCRQAMAEISPAQVLEALKGVL